jgi:ferredoxin
LADEIGRQALRCIRCSACLNICPVYERTGGHAYDSVYPGPIGAILTPQLARLERGNSLPWASSLCGACYEVCPVKIDIPSVLIHLRGRVVREAGAPGAERAAMRGLARVFASRRRYEAAQRALRFGRGPLATRSLAGALPGPCERGRVPATCPRFPTRPFASGGNRDERRCARRRHRRYPARAWTRRRTGGEHPSGGAERRATSAGWI